MDWLRKEFAPMRFIVAGKQYDARWIDKDGKHIYELAVLEDYGWDVIDSTEHPTVAWIQNAVGNDILAKS